MLSVFCALAQVSWMCLVKVWCVSPVGVYGRLTSSILLFEVVRVVPGFCGLVWCAVRVGQV